MKQDIILIAAVGRDGAIGRDGQLIWRMREDMRRFRRLTTGHPVVMGRRTFESLPAALPDRRNIVITRNAALAPGGAETAPSPEAALAMCAGESEVFIIGGGEIYRHFMPLATRLEITLVDRDTPDADTSFPKIDTDVWQKAGEEAHEGYSFISYVRKI